MAKVIKSSLDGLGSGNFNFTGDEISIMFAKALYNEGYHKQSEGEWIDKPTGAYRRMQSWCSACGKHSGIGGIESNRHKPYCPNCGAKMKGGEK
jgi:hypothetical protein